MFDLYSRGKDGQTSPALTAASSKDDVVVANDGGFIGLGKNY
jgi:general secretion pathway protein G